MILSKYSGKRAASVSCPHLLQLHWKCQAVPYSGKEFYSGQSESRLRPEVRSGSDKRQAAWTFRLVLHTNQAPGRPVPVQEGQLLTWRWVPGYSRVRIHATDVFRDVPYPDNNMHDLPTEQASCPGWKVWTGVPDKCPAKSLFLTD